MYGSYSQLVIWSSLIKKCALEKCRMILTLDRAIVRSWKANSVCRPAFSLQVCWLVGGIEAIHSTWEEVLYTNGGQLATGDVVHITRARAPFKIVKASKLTPVHFRRIGNCLLPPRRPGHGNCLLCHGLCDAKWTCLDNWQLTILPQSERCFPYQSSKIKTTNMFIARTWVQFKIKTGVEINTCSFKNCPSKSSSE